MTKADLKAVPDVDIDEGVFKYVYIRYVDCQVRHRFTFTYFSTVLPPGCIVTRRLTRTRETRRT